MDGATRRYIVWYTCSGCKVMGGCPGHTETLPVGSLEKDAVERRAELTSTKAKRARVVVTKLTFGQVADEWLEDTKLRVAPASYKKYDTVVRLHLRPRFGKRKLTDITIDDVANMVAELKAAGKAPWYISAILVPLSRIYASSIRKGWVGFNPVKGLERGERPTLEQKKMEILDSAEIQTLLASTSDRWRPLFATLVFTGMRIGEALDLRWSQIDFDKNLVTIGKSKTAAGRYREIVLMPSLGSTLRRHKLASTLSADTDFVFPNDAGGQGSQNSVRSALLRALKKAKITKRLRIHDMRHTFASILVGQGLDVTFVSAQLGHKTPAITLSIYAKLFDPAKRRDEARERLEAAFGDMLRGQVLGK
jgi:integrase